MKLLLLNNYDSFVYNLRHLLMEIENVEVEVILNDQISIDQVDKYDAIVLSPGPGIPSEAGLMMNIISEYAGKKPIFGVCLGHQAIAEAFGGRIKNIDTPFHGVSSKIDIIESKYIFKDIGDSMQVGRYHSWVVSEDNLPESLVVTSRSSVGDIMSISHITHNIHGVQFHPESILTPQGTILLKNWISKF
ncbi:MAG: anthranilate synthase component II [Bacteroidales bacterium]